MIFTGMAFPPFWRRFLPAPTVASRRSTAGPATIRHPRDATGSGLDPIKIGVSEANFCGLGDRYFPHAWYFFIEASFDWQIGRVQAAPLTDFVPSHTTHLAR